MIYAMSTILEMWLKITTMEMKYNAIWIQMIKLSREMICESMVTGPLQMLQASNGAMCIQTDLELFFFFSPQNNTTVYFCNSIVTTVFYLATNCNKKQLDLWWRLYYNFEFYAVS